MTAPVLMVLGTASSVGKSLLVTAFCRLFAQDGVAVAPFKSQNMSNNADVTPDGLEIGRSQSEQAAAAHLAPAVEMNPILLKPSGDRTSHVILNGRPAGTRTSADFMQSREDLWAHAAAALDTLRGRYDLVVAEGAGAAIEPNLAATEIVNLRVARYAEATTLLVGDIDRGGVFGHLLGTVELMPEADRRLIRGFLLNRFRGDQSLLAPAIEDLERRTGIPVLGVIPWIDAVALAEEDAVALERRKPGAERTGATVDVAVVHLPRVANFDDFDPLQREPSVRLRYVSTVDELGDPDLLILPGTRATIADLEFLRSRGLDEAIRDRAAHGTHILGICGGYQMLGEWLFDPEGVEAEVGASVTGLGLLPIMTTFGGDKQTIRVTGTVLGGAGPWAAAQGAPVEGYEIHMGQSGGDTASFLELDGHPDGAISADGRVAGTYLHGLFGSDALRRGLLAGFGVDTSEAIDTSEAREREFDRLAAVVREHVDMDAIRAMLWPDQPA
ncbi:MAG: cobyric acid synthase [Chloroflexi bacterium]|nr:cobyric acid synthase [Chloroflexota bacterium]MDA1146269.1 cobyric acid synthase [Chloroflexota bacterium]